jgi:hypothetical protein
MCPKRVALTHFLQEFDFGAQRFYSFVILRLQVVSKAVTTSLVTVRSAIIEGRGSSAAGRGVAQQL